MKTKHLLAASCAAFLGFTSAFAGGEGWTHDFAAARKQAADEKKDLLIDFTGSDWCGWCERLNEQVFIHAPFKAGVKDKFVLVELDYPQKPENVAKLSDETKAQNKELQAKYDINGFPTILLCDAEGRPYAKTGFKKGGPEIYVTHLDELRAKKDVRDKSFAEAAKLEGLAKAKVLVAALDAISDMQLEDLTVARCYPDVVDQIKAADPKDETGYGKKLAAKAKLVDFQTEFQGLLTKQDMAGALAFIEKSAASGDFEVETKQQVIQSKIWVFICMKKFDDAIKAVEEAKAVAPESELARRIDKYWPSEIEKEKAKAGAKGEEKPAEPLMRVTTDAASGQTTVLEGNTRVLQYNHKTVNPPPETLAKIAAANLKYARPRSDYIHPLLGPSGEELTLDWAVDHPHHRGIYWAWPEVMFGTQTGDLHALQRVFARPDGKPTTSNGDEAAVIEAQSVWKWEDQTPIVREKVCIRAEKAGPHGRRIDLTITLTAVADGVSLARRETDKYGGLNSRFAAAKALALTHHADAEGAAPRMAWHRAVGTWSPSTTPASVTIFENTANPGYPADHVEFPELAWFQPTFPKAGTRHPLKQGEPLVLKYRYLIRAGDVVDEKLLRDEWLKFNPPQPASIP